MTLHQLAIFEAVARSRSFTRAAEELRLTQPALSAQVRQLEQDLGASFFERGARQLELTEAGRELVTYARRLFGMVDELRTVMDDLRQLKRGRVTVSTVSTAGAYVVPPLLGAFRERHPGIVISLEVANRATVMRRLAENETDLVIMGRPPERFPHAAKPFLSDSLVAIGAASSPLHRVRRLPLARLAQEPFVMREPGSGTRLAVEDFFRSRRLALRVEMELSSPSAVKAAVAAGLGVSVLSRHAIRAELKLRTLRVLEVAEFPLERRWYVAHRQDKRLSRAAQAFLEFLLTSAESVLGDEPPRRRKGRASR